MNIDRRKKIFKKIHSLIDDQVLLSDAQGYVLECTDARLVGDYIEVPDFQGAALSQHKGWTYRKLTGHDGKAYLLVMDNKKQSTQITLQLVAMIFEEEVDDLSKDEVVIDYLKGRITDDIASELLGPYKNDFEKSMTVCILEHHNGYSDEVETILRNLFPDAHVLPYDKNRFVMIFLQEDIREELGTIVTAVSEELLIEPRIGVGTYIEGFLKMKESFEDASHALNIAKVYKSSDRVSYYKNLALPIMIDQMDDAQLNRIYKAILGNVHAVIDDEELILTARRFFEHSLNVTDTAQVLFIHRNTLIYRLNKIEKLTGFDLRKFEDALNFYIGLYMYNRINH